MIAAALIDGFFVPEIGARYGASGVRAMDFASIMLYLHGSVASRMLRVLANGTPICVTVTLWGQFERRRTISKSGKARFAPNLSVS